jgi:RNA polymerase sigma-70 factor (ECF subfamily)
MRQVPTTKTAPARPDDAELVRRALGREEAAVRAIVQANNRRIYRLARGILRNDAEAEDVVQDTYVRAFTHLEQFRGDSSLSTWLSRIAMNEALGRLRRQKPGTEWSELEKSTAQAQISPFPLTRVLEGMNVEETAEILGLKPETVKTRLHRARNLLRDNVERKIGPVVMEAFPFAGRRCERLTEAVLTRLGYRA